MSHFLESLESRTFLSVSPAVVTLHNDEAAVMNDLKVIRMEGAFALKTITADLKAAHLQKTDHAQVRQLSKDYGKLVAAVGKVVRAAQSKVNADVNRFEADEAHLAKKPGNEKLTEKVTVAGNTLLNDAATALAAFPNAESGTAAVADLNAIISDGGAAGAAASTALATGTSEGTAQHMSAVQAYSTDVSAIVGPI